MFSTQVTIWLTLSILAMQNLIQLVSADIVYVPNWQIPYPGEPNDRVIYLVGDAHNYEVIASNYNGYQQSDARCETQLSEGHYSGPCLTTVQFHNQVFNIRDVKNPSNAVSVQFFVNGGVTDHQAQIVTAGNCFGGFTNEKIHAPLRKSGTSPIIGHGDRVSVVINCKSNSRGTYGVTN